MRRERRPDRCERIFVHIRQARRGGCRTEGFAVRPFARGGNASAGTCGIRLSRRCAAGDMGGVSRRKFSRPARRSSAGHKFSRSPRRSSAKHKFSRPPHRASAGRRKIRKNRPQLLTSGVFCDIMILPHAGRSFFCALKCGKRPAYAREARLVYRIHGETRIFKEVPKHESKDHSSPAANASSVTTIRRRTRKTIPTDSR